MLASSAKRRVLIAAIVGGLFGYGLSYVQACMGGG